LIKKRRGAFQALKVAWHKTFFPQKKIPGTQASQGFTLIHSPFIASGETAYLVPLSDARQAGVLAPDLPTLRPLPGCPVAHGGFRPRYSGGTAPDFNGIPF